MGKSGKSYPNFWGGYTHYDAKGNKIGKSYPNFWGGYTTYDKKGNKIDKSYPNFWGGYTHENNEGCYIATAVYGSYNCKEVWVLRRYRDYVLYEHFIGRIFIKIYYIISPKIVRIFGKKQWFNKMWKNFLDKKVKNLKDKGYKDLPYQDRF